MVMCTRLKESTERGCWIKDTQESSVQFGLEFLMLTLVFPPPKIASIPTTLKTYLL